MPRFAIGDLTIDLDVPARFACEYALSGALVALDASSGTGFEVSGLNVGAAQGVNVVRQRASEAAAPLAHDMPDFVSFSAPPNTWFAGLGEHLVIATVRKPELLPGFPQILASIGAAHDAFPAGDAVAFSALRPSHTRWFEQRRTSLLDAISWSPQGARAAEKLDDFWEELLSDPPAENNLLNTMLSGVAVGFGDLLLAHGFEWCVAKDQWGTSIGVVALKGTANVAVVPSDFVAKRWERQELRFVADGVRAMAAQVARASG